MSALSISASTLANACGVGWREVRRALHGETSGLRRNDFEPAASLETYIGRVDGLEAHRLPQSFAAFDCRNNRLAHLTIEQDGFTGAVERARKRYGAERIGLFLGTSTSGILSSELAFRAQARQGVAHSDKAAPGDRARDGVRPLSPELYRCVHGMFAPTDFVRACLRLGGPALTVSTACSSSAKVFATAVRMIAAGFCDAAVVGGADSLALSTLFGFRSLDLLSRNACRPLDADRDGISIGEAAGFALLEKSGDGAISLRGVGESSDAYHMSSPPPNGAGAAKAMRAALADAQLQASDIDYINLHGTASRANDAAEDCAVADVFGTQTPVSSTKGYTGHALGAAGITEALIVAMALQDQWLPGTVNCLSVDAALRCAVMRESQPRRMRHALSNSFGFGGNNCTLVLGLAR